MAQHPFHLAFAVREQVRYVGRPEEQATMFFLEPSENAIELKSFRNPTAVFTR